MLKRMKQVAMAALAGFAFLMASCSSGSSSSIPFIPSSGSSSSSDSGPTVLEEGEVWTKTETDAKYKAAAALAAELDPNNEKYILFYYEDGKTSYSDRAAWIWVKDGDLTNALSTKTVNGISLGYIELYDGTTAASGVPADVITALNAGESIKAIVRNGPPKATWSWQTNDCELLTATGVKHFLITSGAVSQSTNKVYEIADAVVPTILSAEATDNNTIYVNLNVYYGLQKDTGSSGFVVSNGSTALTVVDSLSANTNDKSKNAANKVILTIQEDITCGNEYTVTHTDFKPDSGVTVDLTTLVKTADEYTGDDLGVTLSGSSATFKTWAPAASSVTLLVYDDIANVGTFDATAVSKKVVGSTTSDTLEGTPSAEYDMTRGSNNVWSYTLSSVGSAKYYKYKIVNSGTTYYVSDIWAKAGTPDAIASVIADINTDTTATNVTGTLDTAWGTKSAYKNPFTGSYENAVIYEMHITDWSYAADSTVGNVGKYSKVASSTVIDHLKDIGVTHVQLLPVFEFAETKANTGYNWGYNPYHYNLPEGRYVVDAEDGVTAVCELRQLIAALHDAGIAVIMDVVYNHTSGTGDYSLYDSTVPKYFYRFNADGSYSSGSGCGNEIDSEAAMAKKYIIDSLKHWMLDYHFNGFRFDLMGCLSKETMADIYTALYDIDPKVMVYGEPWTGGTAQVQDGATQAVATSTGLGVGAFDDDFRDAIKGAEFGGFQRGQVQDANKDAEIIKGLLGQVGANKRNETGTLGLALHYIECHDNYTLFDKLAISKWQDLNNKTTTTTGNLFTKIGEEGLVAVKAQDKLAAAYVFLSQGTTFMNGGQEFLRTKKGNENSYNTAISTNGIDLTFADTYSDVYNVYKGLIALRKSAPEAFGANTNASASKVSTGVTKYTTGDYLVYFNASAAAVNVSSSGYTKVVDVTSGSVVESTTLPTSVAAKSFVIFKK
jgi:pullulanase